MVGEGTSNAWRWTRIGGFARDGARKKVVGWGANYKSTSGVKWRGLGVCVGFGASMACMVR